MAIVDRSDLDGFNVVTNRPYVSTEEGGDGSVRDVTRFGNAVRGPKDWNELFDWHADRGSLSSPFPRTGGPLDTPRLPSISGLDTRRAAHQARRLMVLS